MILRSRLAHSLRRVRISHLAPLVCILPSLALVVASDTCNVAGMSSSSCNPKSCGPAEGTFKEDSAAAIPSDDELRKRLSPLAYHVTQEKGTERAFTSDLLKVKEPGVFHCIVCDQPLFETKTKFESGSGWPSFWQPINDKAITENMDFTHGMIRIETVCSKCGAHLGHKFDDGPRPTGMRYCINGVSLKFNGTQ